MAVTNSWTETDTQRALQVWAEYQRANDVTDRVGQTVGVDPESGRVWFGDSAKDIWFKMHGEGIEVPLLYLRVGSSYYIRKGTCLC